MRIFFSVSLSVSVLILTPAVALSQAQSAQVPQIYSFTETNSMLVDGMMIKIARDGSRESMEQLVAPSSKGPGMHVRALYDFAAHKLWTIDLTGHPCTVVTYTSPSVPSMYDPISGAEEMTAGLAQQKPAVLRSETINGIGTKVYELPFPDINGKLRLFLEEKHNFAVKLVNVGADGKEQTQMEITGLSYAKPPANLFVAPQNCQALAGETNATGGHVEMNIDASTQAGEQKLAPAKPAQKPAAAPASRAAAPAAAAQVIEVRGAGVNPVHYTGPAPAAYQFSFTIDASGPVEAEWVLVSQADTAWASGKLVFDAAGTQELNVPVKIGVGNGTHWEGSGHLEVVVGAKTISSVTMPISADCRAK